MIAFVLAYLMVYAIDDFNSLLTTALSIVSIATLAGLGLLRGTVTNLRENLKDAREEIADKDRRLNDAEKTLATQKADLEALGRLKTGETQWTALGEQLQEHHSATMAAWKEIKTELLSVIRKLARNDS